MVGIVPAAGKGTRMLGVTGGGPKELLPLGSKTVLERVVAEAYEAGCHSVVVVGSPEKPGLHALVHSMPGVRYAEQCRPLGLGHAIACSGIRGESALVLMADALIWPPGALRALVRAIEEGAWAGATVRRVADADVSRYGMVEFGEGGEVVGLLEKPAPSATTSRWAVAGRYAFGKDALDALAHEASLFEGPGEHHPTPLIQRGIASGHRFAAIPIGDARVLDCGSPEGYREACAVLS